MTDDKATPDTRALIAQSDGLIEFGDYSTSNWAIRMVAALAAERDRADRAEARLAEVRKYTFSISNGSTVARRILQMSEATA